MIDYCYFKICGLLYTLRKIIVFLISSLELIKMVCMKLVLNKGLYNHWGVWGQFYHSGNEKITKLARKKTCFSLQLCRHLVLPAHPPLGCLVQAVCYNHSPKSIWIPTAFLIEGNGPLFQEPCEWCGLIVLRPHREKCCRVNRNGQ